MQLVDDEKSATYQLVYKYPEDEAKLKERKANTKKLTDELERTDPNVSDDRPVGNYQYTMNFGKDADSRDLAPALVYDNGQFTYLDSILRKMFLLSTEFQQMVNHWSTLTLKRCSGCARSVQRVSLKSWKIRCWRLQRKLQRR